MHCRKFIIINCMSYNCYHLKLVNDLQFKYLIYMKEEINKF